MNIAHIIIVYIIAVNILTFIIYGIDKLKAKKGRWRIPETTLLFFAVIGGSIGAWAGIKVWHHKTKHKKFKYGVPAIIVLQVAAVVAFFMLTSCSENRHLHNRESEKEMLGAYTEYRDVTADEKEMFISTYEGEVQLTPVKVMTQVVAGTNFRFLCNDKDGNRYEVTIFKSLPVNGGKTEVTSVRRVR